MLLKIKLSTNFFKVSFFLLFLIALLSFRQETNYGSLQNRIDQNLHNFQLQSEGFNDAAESFKLNRIPLDSLQGHLHALRAAFKRAEFLLAYRYPEFVERHINGAPLLQIQRHSTLPFVVPPQGLQVLDELLYSDIDSQTKSEIALQSQELENQVAVLVRGYSKDDRLSKLELLESIRLQLIRIFNLGLSGFDTPGSLNGIEESRISLQEMGTIFKLIEAPNGKEISQGFEQAQFYLKQNTSFEDFDRAFFIRVHLDPLYRELRFAQAHFGGQTVLNTPWQWNSSSLFDPKFLDPYYFTELKLEDDSPALRSLGAKLFRDPILSNTKSMSCASCHNPKLAFSDGKKTSLAQRGTSQIQRNSPGLFNAVYADRFFYDLRAFSLEQQAEHVIFNPQEFNTAYDQILEKLEQDASYKQAFASLFPDQELQAEHLSSALASYVLSLQSFNSPFDKYIRGETDQIDEKVKQGFNLFMGKSNCGTCHFPPTFSGLVPPLYRKNESEILGVKEHPGRLNKRLDRDPGRIENGVSSEKAWIYENSFKTPGIRNIEFTAPYFHNGAYPTLEQLIDFYVKGGGEGMGLELKNQTLPADSLSLSNTEKQALIAFLVALSDTSSFRQGTD